MARLLLVFVAALCACAALAASASAASLEWVDRCPDKPYPIPALEEADAECGWLTVPENRAEPNGRQLQLPVAKLPARDRSEAPIVYMEGGPGGPALPNAGTMVEAGLTREHDVYLLGQRGTAYARPSLTCKEVDAFTVGSTDLAYDAPATGRAMVAAHAKCRERLADDRIDFSAYDTTESAADFADLRTALGGIDWHVLGASYGTDLALTYLRRYPDGLVSVTLDSVVPPEAATLSLNWRSAGLGVRELFDACRDQPRCRARYGDVGATFARAVKQLEREPLVKDGVKPALPDRDPERGAKPVKVRLDGGGFANLVFALSEVAPQAVPWLIDGVARGGPVASTEAAAAYALTKQAHVGLFSYGLHNGVVCSEWLPYEPVEEVAEEGRRWFGDFPRSVLVNAPQFPFMDDVCKVWPVRRAPAEQRAAPLRKVPTAIVGGSFDALTAVANGVAVTRSLSDSEVFDFPGFGHFVLRQSPCAATIVRAWARASVVPDYGCLREIEPRPFKVDGPSRARRRAAAQASAATATAASRDAVTPVTAALLPQRAVVPVKGSDGRWHAMYELVLTNTLATPARIDQVQVRAADGGRVVARYGPRAIVAGELLHRLDRTSSSTATLAAGQTQVLLLSLAFPTRRAIPRALEHRFTVSARDAFTARTTRLRYDVARVAISGRAAPVLAPPLRGAGWLASDGCCRSSGHVSAIYGLAGQLQAAERYAIDWIKLTPEGRIFDGDPKVLGNWAGYGAPVTSVGDGVVTRVLDGLPDQTPQVKPGVIPFPELPGNHVVVRMRGGLSAVFAHFVPGSVAVRVGQRVRAGDLLGRLGNSGASLAPHLHFHVVDGDSAATSDGTPFVLDRFGISGNAGLPQLLGALRGEAGFPRPGSTPSVEHDDELPLGFTVNDFPG